MNGYRAKFTLLSALIFLLAGCGDSKDGDTKTDGVPADTLAMEDTDTVAVADSGSSDVVADDTVVAPTDSESGDASVDAGGTAPCGSTASAPCVAVSGTCEVNGGTCFDLVVVGSQFDEYEGQIVRIVTNALGVDLTAAGTVIGVAQAKIVGGSFTLSLPLTLADYTGISLYIDHNCSSTCDVGEPMWGMTTGVTATFDTPYLLELTADDLSPFDMPASSWVGGCANNGADLALNLPCQP
jgi:hypothetical protein